MNIHDICEYCNITNYTINSDGSIDVDDEVFLYGGKYSKLPLKFRNVTGNFYCHENQLTSLEGAPQSVGGNFYCHENKLTSLEGAPQTVGGVFYCDNYLFEEMIDRTKPLFHSRKSWRNKVIYKYRYMFTNEYCNEYFKSIERERKLKELGI